MLKINLKFLKKSKPWAKRLKTWVGKRPLWLKFVVAVILLSTLTSLLAVGLYDRYYGSSPWSNKMRFVKEALAVCNQAQTLAATVVDFGDWPLAKDYGLKGESLDNISGYLDGAGALGSGDVPTTGEAVIAISWLKQKYPDYFTSKSRCEEMSTEYQEKCAY